MIVVLRRVVTSLNWNHVTNPCVLLSRLRSLVVLFVSTEVFPKAMSP